MTAKMLIDPALLVEFLRLPSGTKIKNAEFDHIYRCVSFEVSHSDIPEHAEAVTPVWKSTDKMVRGAEFVEWGAYPEKPR